MADIEKLIPQRAPVVMVDAFLGVEGDDSFSELTVREDNIFLDGDFLTECGLIEHIAQSAAARVGYVCEQKGIPVPVGFIGSVNKFHIDRLPGIGEKLETVVSVIQKVFQITLVEAKVRIGDDVIAGCRMKIFLDTDEDA